jgi:hypothetical protein
MAGSRDVRGALHFQNPDEFFIQVVIVIGNARGEHQPALQEGPVVPCKPVAVGGLHHQVQVGPEALFGARWKLVSSVGRGGC